MVWLLTYELDRNRIDEKLTKDPRKVCCPRAKDPKPVLTDSEMTGTQERMETLFLLCSGKEVKFKVKSEFYFLPQCFTIVLITSYENKEMICKNVNSRGYFVLS